jgi:hypothetical protein
LITSRSPAQTVINFEDIQTTGHGTGGQTRIARQYEKKGLVLNDVYLLDYSKTALADFAHSGTRAIEQCYAGEGCETPFELGFTRPQSRVKVWAGYFGELRGNAVVRLEAFDANGKSLRVAQAKLDSKNAVRIRTPLEVVADDARIQRAVVSIRGTRTNGFALDDIEFEAVALLPDLVVRDVAHRIDGEHCTLDIKIENIGRAVSSPTSLAITSEGHTLRADVATRLLPGRPFDVTVDVTWPLAPGSHAFRIAIDPDRQIKEEHDDNNSAEHTIEIAAPTVIVPNVVGLGLGEARATLEGAGLVANGAFADLDPVKARVRNQTPAAGVRVPLRATVNLVAEAPASLPWWPAAAVVAVIVGATGYTLRARKARPPLHPALTIQSRLGPARSSIDLARARFELPSVRFRFTSGTPTHRVLGEPLKEGVMKS